MSDDGSRTGSGRRSTTERLVFAASTLVIGAIVGVLLWASVQGSDEPPSFRVHLSPVVVEADGSFSVPVVVSNQGGRTAAEVVVSAEVGEGPAQTRLEQTIDFLFAGDSETVTFVLSEDPGRTSFRAAVDAYQSP